MHKAIEQTTDSLLMIRPANCGYNPQTAASNSFQKQAGELSAAEISEKARGEFDCFVEILRREDIDVFVFDDTPAPAKPDAVFPNNWISFHADGTVFLYPMLSEKRNAERRLDIVENLKKHFQIKEIIDLSRNEKRILEGTGSMVLDRANKIVYACLSPRTDAQLLKEFAARIDYKPVAFVCSDENGAAIYHTNVVMCVGEKFAVVCLDALENQSERKNVIENLTRTNHEIVEITTAQMNEFAGNMLEVRNRRGEKFLIMSARARKSLDEKQTTAIEKHARILSAEIEIIETVGGGGVRCMLAEIFLAKNFK